MLAEKTSERSQELQSAEAFGRNSAIDFVKGSLVLSMVIYHSLNYTMNDSYLFRYLRFVTLGFICISGFVITRVLRGKYETRTRVLHRKLLVKGVKLILLFTAVNLLISFFLGRENGTNLLSLKAFAGSIASIYLAGNGTRAVFEILLPIGYLMLISPLVLVGLRLGRLAFYCVLVATGAYWVSTAFAGQPLQLVSYLSIGLFGLLIGACPAEWLDLSSLLHKVIVVTALVVYVALASVFNSPLLVNVFGTISALASLWLIAALVSHRSPIVLQIDKLGRYSLFAYMMQIALLQLIMRLGINHSPGVWLFVLMFFEALVLTVTSVIILDKAVHAWKAARVVYGWVFS